MSKKENIEDLKELEKLGKFPKMEFKKDGSVTLKNKKDLDKIKDLDLKIKEVEENQEKFLKEINNLKILLNKNLKRSRYLKNESNN
jgi:hypothetical protein